MTRLFALLSLLCLSCVASAAEDLIPRPAAL